MVCFSLLHLLDQLLLCFKMLTNSVKDPSTTGTRWAWPCNFPLSSGITKPIALAAPVEWE